MASFWKTGDGQWRSGLIAFVLFLLFSASYDFVTEDRGTLSGLGDLLLAVSVIALAPLEAQPRVRPLIWSVSPLAPLFRRCVRVNGRADPNGQGGNS